MIKVFEANYPESLGAILVHRAPWAFNAIWHIIKGWLDPVVAGKVHFTSTVEELSQYIEPTHIPQELGGNDNWQYEYVPAKEGENLALEEDAGVRQRLEKEREETVNAYELATLKWVKQPDSVPLRSERASLREKLKREYWDLDPYVRARSLYDRTGMIQNGGGIQFYPEEGEAQGEEKEAPQKQHQHQHQQQQQQQPQEEQKRVVVNGVTSTPVVNGRVVTSVGAEHRRDDNDDVD